MSTEKLQNDLFKFFKRVNKIRTKAMRGENPNEVYEYFQENEPTELIIRKGMSQYEDLLKIMKKNIRKGQKFSFTEDSSKNQTQLSSNYNPEPENYDESNETQKNNEISKKPKKKKIIKKKEENDKNNEDEKDTSNTYNNNDYYDNQNKPKPKHLKKKNTSKEKQKREQLEREREEQAERERQEREERKKQQQLEEQKRQKEREERERRENEKKQKENEKKQKQQKQNKPQNLNEDIGGGFEKTPIETSIVDIEHGMKIKSQWYYTFKKMPEPENDEQERAIASRDETVNLSISTNCRKRLILHWGLYKINAVNNWFHPPKENYPYGSVEIDDKALQTEFPPDNGGKDRIINIKFKRGEGFDNYIGGINYVIYEPEKNIWHNNHNRNYQIKLRRRKDKTKMKLLAGKLNIPDFIEDIIDNETNAASWTLKSRYDKCISIVRDWDYQDESDNWIWILVWLRYSFINQLTWQRGASTRPGELSKTMAALSGILTEKYSEMLQNENEYDNLINAKSTIIKHILSLIGKGADNFEKGGEIRSEILNIMQKNQLRKTSRNNFYQDWHVKLHNNNTPDDIIICQAVINFLKAKGDLSVYWKTLNDNGITREKLQSYETKILNDPWYNPSINVGDFEKYLQILKKSLSPTDLSTTYNSCKSFLENNTCSIMDDVLKNTNDSDVIKQISRVTKVREQLQNTLKSAVGNMNKLRELIFFELALELYVRQLVEKIIHIKLDYKNYINEISLILYNVKMSYNGYKELNYCYEDWKNIVEPLINDQSRDASLKVKSVMSRISRILSSVIDYYNENYDNKGKYFGKACNCEKFAVDLFTEELIRGSIFFTLSMLLKKLEPIIRTNAKLGDWLIISRGNKDIVTGKLIHVQKLHEIQFTKYNEPTFIISENVSGDEEIPVNCCGLVIIKSENYPDVLAHVSVRARNLNVPFAVCFNENKANNILKFCNLIVDVELQNMEVIFNKSKGFKSKNSYNDNYNNNKIQIVNSGNKYKKIFVELEEFDKKCVGAKSNNTKKVFGKVPNCKWLHYPESFAIPFNVHEYFLTLENNVDLKDEINDCIEKISREKNAENIRKLLDKCKNLTMKIEFIENDETEKLKNRLFEFGIMDDEFQEAFKAIKSVWASKFNERVYIATSKVGISLYDIKMSVLCQKIIPAEYAYVIHTKNPTNNNPNEVFAELVVGMGETLVGAYEGQSFSFSYNKKTKKYEILSYPNKTISLKNSGFIFRSDSNTEDLEGFSGAGLFDSIPMVKDTKVEMLYYSDKLFYDKAFAENIICKISELGINVEKMYGIPQDIEGVYYNKDFYIVQTRPQV